MPRPSELFRMGDENPVAALVLRRVRKPGQLSMCISAFVFAASVLTFIRHIALEEETFGLYIVLRWTAGIFLAIWLASDHIFSFVRKCRAAGETAQWALTPLKTRDVAEGLAAGTYVILFWGFLGWALLEILVPLPDSLAATPFEWLSIKIVVPVAVGWSTIVIAWVACMNLGYAAISQPITPVRWARSALGEASHAALILAWTGFFTMVGMMTGLCVIQTVLVLSMEAVGFNAPPAEWFESEVVSVSAIVALLIAAWCHQYGVWLAPPTGELDVMELDASRQEWLASRDSRMM